MAENNAPFDVATMFHSVLFGYQKALSDIASEKTTELIHDYLIHYLDKSFHSTLPLNDPDMDFYQRFEVLRDMLIRSNIVKDLELVREKWDFKIIVKDCAFSSPVHELLKPEDVTCPIGILAYYLVEKCTGFRVVKALSEFTSTDAITKIEFDEAPSTI